MCRLAHERVNHEVWGVCFDHLCGLGLADDMALLRSCQMDTDNAGYKSIRTMSAPSFALAIAEKYGAPV